MNYHINSNFMQMENSWHIPRATLGSGSGSGSGSGTSSQKSSTSVRSSDINIPETHRGRHNMAFQNNEKSSNIGKHHQSDKSRKLRDIDKLNGGHRNSNGTKSASTENNEAVKRGSQSSQGSSGSNHSSHSASSGSMLLTAANLEHFAQIHKKLHPEEASSRLHHHLYNTNITLPPGGAAANPDAIKSHPDDTILPIDLMRMMASKTHTKDLDTMSVASSTHFTVVNGMGGPQRPTKEGICSRKHQITVLILTMSIIFLIGIVAAVFMLEMRAQRMPHM